MATNKVDWHVKQFKQNGNLDEQMQAWLREVESSTPGIISVQVTKCHDGWSHENKALVIVATKRETN